MSNFKNPILKFKLEPIFEQIQKEFPNLTVELKWNQPMFIMNGTFIIGFSVAKNHISIAPEAVTMYGYLHKRYQGSKLRSNQ
ncbi:TPA: hypothetical protein U1C87_001535 [Streptococcus suis]|nr:hypothetical protein [Streptococcus suis]